MTAINFKFLKYGEKMFTQCISNEIIERIATCLHQFIIKKYYIHISTVTQTVFE